MKDLLNKEEILDLIKKLKKDDDIAFYQLYHFYFKKLFNHVLKVCKSRHLAEEVVQETFIKIWDNRHSISDNLSFSSYIFTIARNEMINLLKRASRESEIYNELFIYAEKATNKTLSMVEFKETERLIEEAINQLPYQRKLIFQLTRNEGFTYDEVANHLGISKSTVNTQISRSIRELKAFLNSKGIAIYS